MNRRQIRNAGRKQATGRQALAKAARQLSYAATACKQIVVLSVTLTSAVLDRLLHHAENVIIEGKSYRLKDRIETP